MRRTNLLLVGLLNVLAAGLVAGCGSDSDNEAAGRVTVTVAGEVVTETVTEQAEPVTVEAEPAAEPAGEPAPDALHGTVALEPAQQTKNGVTMSLTRLSGAPGSTRVYVRIANDTDKTCFFSDYAAVLIADGEKRDRYGETNLLALGKGAAVPAAYRWEREFPADTSAVRVVVRCHCGSFTHGRHILFDIETRVRPT